MISLTETSTARLRTMCLQCNASAVAIEIYGGSLRFRLREQLLDDFVVYLDSDHKLLIDYISLSLIKGALLDFIKEKSENAWVLECPGGLYYG